MRAHTLDEAVAVLLAAAVPEGECLVSRRNPSQVRPQIKVTGRFVYAYRAVWELEHGPLADGHEVHHRCHVPRCVRLAHLQLLSEEEHKEEHRREVAEAVTHCAQGHPFEGSNLFFDGRGWRKCRICSRATTAAYRARQKLTLPESL